MVDHQAAREYYYKRETLRRTQREIKRQQWLQRVRKVVTYRASAYPDIRRVYLFGSLVKPGQFRSDSDIDIAIECDILETESTFWRLLERDLQRNVDLRPLVGPIVEVVRSEGEQVYERQDTHSVDKYPS